jgi:hypothetical protein
MIPVMTQIVAPVKLVDMEGAAAVKLGRESVAHVVDVSVVTGAPRAVVVGYY